MTKTTYMLAASALALTANTASAFDVYGNFSNHETVVHGYGRGTEVLNRGAQTPGPRTSLDVLTAGNPDSSGHSIPGYANVMDPTAPRITSLDMLTAGNPDSAVHPIRDHELDRPASEMTASQPKLERGGV